MKTFSKGSFTRLFQKRPRGGAVFQISADFTMGGDEVPDVGVHVVDELLVDVGVVRRHPADTGGDAPHRLDVRLRGCPAPLHLSCALPFPPHPRASSYLPLGVRVTDARLALGPPPCPQPLVLVRFLLPVPLPVSRVPSSVTRALALSAGARVLSVPLPPPLAVYCVPPSTARALARTVCLSSPAAASTRALPVPLPSLALPLRPSPGACPPLPLWWVWLGLVWAQLLAPTLPSATAAAVPSKVLGIRAGPLPRASGVPGAVARPAGAAAAAPCKSGPPPGGGAAGAAA